jgi:glycosyltransferase involved in cell wall biosynthesis
MKILFVTSESMLDHSYTMINELRKHIDIKPYIIAKELTTEISEFCRDLNAKFIKRYSFKNPLNLFKEIRLLKELKKQKADLVWFDRTTMYQTLLLKRFMGSYLINIHDVELHPEEKDYHGIWTQKLIFKYHKDRIAVMSNTQSKIYMKHFKMKPYKLQLPIIDYYKSIAPPKERKTHGARVKFFFFGSVLPYKGLETLIDAAGTLSSKNADYELNIYGKLRYNRAELREKISQNKNITLADEFIDYREVSSVFSSNDVLVIPYIQVSQCGPLLIAYSYNTPVICSDLEGFREYVTENKSGLIFNSAGDLASKMEYIINDPGQIEIMSGCIKNEIHNKFSMESLAGVYISEFKKVSGNKIYAGEV